jgi:hypothetical protein
MRNDETQDSKDEAKKTLRYVCTKCQKTLVFFVFKVILFTYTTPLCLRFLPILRPCAEMMKT